MPPERPTDSGLPVRTEKRVNLPKNFESNKAKLDAAQHTASFQPARCCEA